VDRCEPKSDGSFLVRGETACLAGQVTSLSHGDWTVRRREHAYKAPYDRNRLGELQVQKHESFIEIETTSRRIEFLTLFAVFGPGECPNRWQNAENSAWSIDTPEGTLSVCTSDSGLSVVKAKT